MTDHDYKIDDSTDWRNFQTEFRVWVAQEKASREARQQIYDAHNKLIEQRLQARETIVQEKLDAVHENSNITRDHITQVAKKIEHVDGRVTLLEEDQKRNRTIWRTLKAVGAVIILVITFRFGDIPDVWTAMLNN